MAGLFGQFRKTNFREQGFCRKQGAIAFPSLAKAVVDRHFRQPSPLCLVHVSVVVDEVGAENCRMLPCEGDA
ncbi:MAG: hypothetical protein RR772_05020, partial [Gordonibacter sp.]